MDTPNSSELISGLVCKIYLSANRVVYSGLRGYVKCLLSRLGDIRRMSKLCGIRTCNSLTRFGHDLERGADLFRNKKGCGAGGRTRTDMSLTSPDFESGAYTNFATPAASIEGEDNKSNA